MFSTTRPTKERSRTPPSILQDAFLANEYHPALQGLPRDEKEKVDEFLTKLDVLKNQLEVRAFEQVEGQIADIKKIATDFDSTEAAGPGQRHQAGSRLQLGKARMLAQGGQLADAMVAFQTAAELWPGNPDLTTSSNLFFKLQDFQMQSTGDFDRLVRDQNYREIFDRQLEFALAVKGDPAREQQIKDALEKVQKAKMAEEKANMMVMNGDTDGAWETVELAMKDWPDDTKLNKLLADLSGRSRRFCQRPQQGPRRRIQKGTRLQSHLVRQRPGLLSAEPACPRRHRTHQQADSFAAALPGCRGGKLNSTRQPILSARPDGNFRISFRQPCTRLPK